MTKTAKITVAKATTREAILTSENHMISQTQFVQMFWTAEEHAKHPYPHTIIDTPAKFRAFCAAHKLRELGYQLVKITTISFAS